MNEGFVLYVPHPLMDDAKSLSINYIEVREMCGH